MAVHGNESNPAAKHSWLKIPVTRLLCGMADWIPLNITTFKCVSCFCSIYHTVELTSLQTTAEHEVVRSANPHSSAICGALTSHRLVLFETTINQGPFGGLCGKQPSCLRSKVNWHCSWNKAALPILTQAFSSDLATFPMTCLLFRSADI